MVNGSGTTSNPTDGEETTAVAETPADPIVVPAEETATVESSTDNVVETPTETVSTTVTPTTVVAEAPATTESTTMTPTTVTDVGATTEQAPVTETESDPEVGLASTESATSTPSVATTSVADTEGQSAETTAATTSESAQPDTALTTEDSAAETADTTTTDTNIQDDTTVDTVADEQSDTDTTADTTSTTNDNDDVKPNSEVSSDASSATTILSESASESKATVLGETSTQEATVLTDDYVPTTEPEGVTVSVDTTIPVPNKEDFTGSEYGLSSTVTVTYSDKYLWINLPAVYNLNSIDMDALKAYAVRNRMIISFLQDGEQAKNTTTGLTDAQQATFDLFNKDAFNLMPATEVTNDDGTIIVYWPDSTEASTTFDSVDHDDIRIWAETNGLGWVVASEAWRRVAANPNLPTGDSVGNGTDLPTPFQNDKNLMNFYYYADGFMDATNKTKWLVGIARNVTSDPWGNGVVAGGTIMLTAYNDNGIIDRKYIAPGATLVINGTTVRNNMKNGSGDFEISSAYALDGTGSLTNWRTSRINVFATADDANYYYAIDNGDGTYTKTTQRIPVNTANGASGDAKTNTLYGGASTKYSDTFTVTSDLLPGYQLVPSLTDASGKSGTTTTGSGTSIRQTVSGTFSIYSLDKFVQFDSRGKTALMDPNNPFNLALIRAYGFNLDAVPQQASVTKYMSTSTPGDYTTYISWPAVDANGNVTSWGAITWDAGSNTMKFTIYTSGATTTAGNPINNYTIPKSPLTFYLVTDTATGKTSVVAATAQPTNSGMTYSKITGDLYRTTSGEYTLSATDAFGNANAVIATPDWLDEDQNGSVDGGSFTGFKGNGFGNLGGVNTARPSYNSGVSFYYVAAPQVATVGLQTATKNADGSYTLTTESRSNTAGVSNYNNTTAGQTNSALQGVTGGQIGVKTANAPNNDWSKINTKVPGYTYIGYTLNGGSLQSVQKSDGTYAMPYENGNSKYNATASTSLSNGVITDSSADGIVLYYAIDSQQAQIKFVMADGTTAPANINLTGKTGGALTQDVASSIPAGYHIDTTKTTTTGSPAMTLSGTTVSGTYDATNNNLSATDASLQTMTITLVADTQTVKVRYIDVNGSTKETGWTAADGTEITDWVQTASGATGKTYTNVLGSVSQSGYVIVAQDAGATAGTFDNDTATDQTYYVYLKHNTVDVEGGKEGNARWTVRSTVRYRFEDGTNAASANVRTTEFLVTVTYDAVTGEELAVTWETETYTFDDVESPVIQGYIADKLEAGAATVTYTSAGIAAIVTYKALGAWTPSFPDTTPDNPPSDITYPNDPNDPTQPDRSNPSVPVVPYVPGYTPEGPNGPLTPVNPNDPSGGYLPPDVPTDPTTDTTIVYHANEQTVTVNYIYVADDGTRTTVKTESFTGKSNAAYTHELWDYENNPDQSYVLVSKDAGAESGVFDAVDDETQVFNVILAIGTESVPGGKDDDPNQSDYTKTVTRTIHYVDQAGNQMVDANGEPVPDRIMRHTFTATVTYKVDSNVPVSVEWPNDAATFEEVKSPVIAGYVSDVTQVDADNIDHADTDMTYTVTYKPMGSWTPSFPPNTENVPSDPIQYPNDPNNPTDNETPHDPAEPDDPVIPYVPGYTPEGPDGTPLKPVDPENPSAGYIPPAPTDPTGDTTINYTRYTQQIIVRYIDDTTNLEVPDLRQTFSGETDQAYTNTLADYAALGYTFVSADAGASAGTYDRDDSKTQVYLVHLTHGTVVVDGGRENDPNHDSYTSTVTSTVHYVYETDQTESKPDSVQEKIFTASVTYDAVTGEVLSIVWPAESQNFDDVQTPVIDGYFASEGSVAGDAVDYNDANREETVTYTKLGSWIPHVPDLPEEEQLKTRVYPNDPNDASKVWTRDDPNYVEVPVPYIPGYTPTTDGSSIPLDQIDPNDVTKGYYPPTVPDNPAADTPIYYVAHPQTLVVVYVDVSTGTEVEVTELQQTLTGTTNAAYTNTLSDYAARGYVLVNQDATATEGKYDNADNVTQFAKVYLDHGTVVVTPDNPGDPDNPSAGYWPPKTPTDNPGGDTTITYTANEQKATVTFIDDTTGDTLQVVDLTGKSDKTDAYRTATDIATYERAGYVLVSDDYPTDGVVYDRVDDEDQPFTVHLKQVTITVEPNDPKDSGTDIFTPGDPVDPSDPSSPTYPESPYTPGDPVYPDQPDGPTVPDTPGDPGTPVDPDNPSGPTWPATPTYLSGVTKDDLNQTVTRTITYTYASNGEKASETVTETLTYSRTATVNAVTGAVTYGNWQTTDSTLDKVDSPLISGYVASQLLVDEEANVDAMADDKTVAITYTKLGQWVPSFPPSADDENVPSDPIDYPNNPSDPTAPLEPGEDNPNDPGTPANPTLPYVPGYTPEGPDGTPLTPVDPDNPSAGYWPPETPADKPGDNTVIHYVANDQAARITYIDDDTGLELAVDTIAGESSDTSTYTTADHIKSYEAQGYTLVSNDFPEDEFQFDRDDATEQKFEVHLKRTVLVITPDDPRTPNDPIFTPGEPVDPSDPSSPTYPAEPGTPGEPIDPANPSGPTWPETPTYPAGLTAEDLNQTVNLTVNYVYEDGTTVAHDPHTDAVHFTRTATLDTVTGEVTYSDWVAVDDDDLLDTYKSPVVDGYYADKAYSTAVTVAATDDDVTETVTYKKLGQWVPSFPATTPSAPTDPIDYPNDPSDPTVPTDQAENPSEPGTPENPTLPYVPGYTPEGPDGEPLTPADPSNPSSGYLPPNPTNPGDDTVITYVPADQVGSVTYVDQTTGETLVVDSLAGKSDEPGTYVTADRIKQYEAMGYVLVSDDYPTDFTFDSDTAKSQDFTVTLKQATVVVTPDDPNNPSDPIFTPGDPVDPSDPSSPTYPEEPGTPGDPIDPNNPSGPTWPATPTYPAGVTAQDLNKTVTRTVTYVYEDGSEAATTVTDNVVFERTATVNDVTGAVTYGEWTAVGDDVDWQQVDSPMIVGYMADKASVEFVDVTGATESTSVVVTYTAVGQWVPHFPPGTENVPSDPINYPNNPDDPTNPADPGPDNPADPGTTDNPTLPYVPGFTPQGPDGQPLEPVNPSNPSAGYWPPVIPDDPKQSQDITYTANEQTARIVFIDDTTGTTLATDDIDGVSDEKSTYTTADRLVAYYAQGYTLVSDDYPADFAFDRVDGNVETFEVHLKHAAITVTPDDPKNPSTPIYTPGDPVDPSDPESPTYPAEPGTPGDPIDPDNPSGPTWPAVPTYPDGVTTTDLNETVNRTITYVDDKGETVFAEATDKVSFTRTATVDAVTGEVTYGAWVATGGDTTFDAVNSPVKTGYYADKEVVAETTGLTATTGDENVQVVYKPMGQWVPSFPAGTENVPSDPTTYPNDPAHADTPLEPGDSNTNVSGTPDNPTMPYVPGFTPQGPDGTPLEPVTPGSPEGGYWPPATPTDNPGGDTVVTYVADEQKATITYHDVTTDTDLSVDTIAGHSDETSSYTTAQRIAMYEQQGYRLVADGYPGTKFTFDRDTATDQAYIVQLERITQTITPDDPKTPSSPIFTPGDPVDPSDPSSPTYPEQPGTPGEPIDPDNPSGPTWPATPTYPAGLAHDDLNQTVTCEVTYVYDRNGATAATTATETLTFTRTATLDTVSGEITYGDWIAAESDTTFDEVTSPTIAGYTANRASVAEATGVAAMDADTSIEVRYVANEQHATITYIDDNTQQTIVMDDITGQSDGTTTYTTADRIAALQAQGYSLVSDGWPADFVFDTDDDTTQAFEVHLKHATMTIDPDDPKTPSSLVYTPGDPVDPDDPDGPTYPAEPGTPGEPIDPNNPSGPTWPATPTYPDGLKTTDLNEAVDRTITYVYEDGSEAAKTATDNVQFTRTAEYDVVTGTVTYGDWVATNGDTTFDAVASPVITGYYADLTQVDETTGLTADSGDENVKVTYKQMGQWVPSFPANTPSVPTDSITYPNNPDDPTQPLEPGAPDYPVIPYVPGFTPAGPDGPLQPVDPTDPSKGYVPPATPTDNPGEDTTINYVANEQMATITFIDDTTKTDLTFDTITGVSDATSTYTTAERIQAYLAQGYTLVSDGYPTDFTFDRDDSQTQAYEVHLKHATITITPSDPKTPSQPIYNPGDPVDPSDPIDPDNPSGPTWPTTPTYPVGLTETDLNESVTQTITYVYADGQEASEPKTDTVTFSRTATLDPVTGAVTYGEWVAANSDTTFDAVASPVITGYVADKQRVAEVTGIQATDADTDPVVTYTAMGQWVPSYPAGTTDVPTDPMTYPSDPIKGYVPPATPTDPTQDTTITYVANEQQATIAYIDKTTGKQLALDSITGHSDESSTYTTADKIAAYEAAGYVLVSDGYPGANFTFDREDDYDQTYEVILEHAVITVDPNDPKTPSSPIFTPGGPVDPDDPTSPTYPVNPGETPTPTYPAGVETADLNESVTQTITYTYADGTTAADDATDTVTFSRTATVDAVTGTVTYGEWIASNGDTTFDAVTSPVITGYVADKQTIAEVTGIAAKDADTTITVVYNQMGQWVPSFPAGTTDVPSSPMTYPNDPTDPTVPLTPGPENENDPGDPANPTLPFVPGFTPQGPDGPLQPVDPANPSSGYWPPTLPSDPTTDTTITYTADEQAATITYVDAVTNEILGVDHIKGGSDESHAYTTANRLAAYLASGYELVSDGYPTNFTFDRDTAVTQAYTVTLTHGSQTINPNDPKTPGTPINPDNPDGTKYPDGLKSTDLNESVTRTITYVDQAGKTMATAVKETIHFTRTATLDTVTGAYTYSAWEPTTVTSMDAVDSPVIAGYVADRQTVAALSDLTATSADMSEKVVYAPIGQYVPAFPSGVTDVTSTPIDYPNNPDDPTTTDTPGEDNPATPGTPDNPTMPYVPGFTPQGPDGPLQPVDPNNPSSGYWPPAPSETPTEDTTIAYTANKQTATITYIDDETGRILAVDTITGGSAETSSYSPYNRIMVYKLAGMMLVSNGYPSHFTFDRDESVDQAFEVHFEGATITVTPDDPKVPGEPIYQPGDLIDPNDPDSPTFPDPLGEPGTPVDPDDPDSPTWPQPPVWPDGVTAADLREEVNQTITYIYEKDGSTAAKTVTDQVVFTRTITINVIAAQQSAQPQARLARAATASPIVYSDWQAVNGDDKFDAKTSPVIPGYIADRLVVEEVADMDETSEDDIQQVVYRQLGSWVPSVPQVPGVKTPADVTYPNDPDDPTKTADPNSPGYPVIPYVPGFTPQGPDGTPLQPVDPKDPSQGYWPPTVPNDPTTDPTIVYRVDQQRATVNFIDQNTKQVLHVEQLTGDSYSKSTYTTTDQIAGYLARGYVLVRDGYPAGGMTFDADSAHNQTFVVTLAHGTTTVDPNHPGVPGMPIDPNNPTGPKWPAGTDKSNLTDEVERIVRYLNDAGQTVAEAQTQTVTFTRTATVDLVTGQVTYGPWQSIQSAEMAAITSPRLAGYIVDRPTVASATVQAGQGDWVETVRDHAVGSYVPQVPGGVPVDYVTNPNDPSGILTPGEPGSPVLPHVPGYVPVGPDGKPLQPVDPNDPRQDYWPPAVADPTQDTPITYVQIVTDQVTPDDATPAPSDSAVAVDHQAPVSDGVVLDSDAVLPTAEVSAASQLTTSGGSLAYTASSAATTEPTDVANETPTKHSGVLPYTGQDDQEGAKATGLAMLFGLFLGLFKRRKRKDESDETTKHHEDR
ncbi:mucus-binding protein [Weissella cibaria]|nr:mucus-binding protein [Weissella cibaria]